MAYLVRLIVTCLLIYSGAANAIVTSQPYYIVDMMLPAHYSDEVAACVAAIAFENNRSDSAGANTVRTFTGVKPSLGRPACWAELFERSSGASFGEAAFVFVYLGGQSCPQNSVAVSGGCQCSSGYPQQGNSCVALGTPLEQYCKSLKGSSAPLRVRTSSVNNLGQVCEVPFYSQPGVPDGHGCISELGSGIKTSDAEGVQWTQATGITSDATCTGPLAGGDTSPSAEPTKDPCPNGYAASVNGSQICAQHDPAGSLDWSSTKTTENGDGTKTDVETQTSCKAGVCSTTIKTTTTAADGSASSTSNTTKDTILGTCAVNPWNGVCSATGTGTGGGGGGVGKTGFGGTCVTGFKAESDDAVMAAMALEQHKRNCQLLSENNNASQAMGAEMSKTGNQTGDNPNNQSVSIAPGDIDTSDALGGGSCSLDKTIVVRGMSVTLPFNVLCDPLAMFGQLIVAVSMLLAARIVTRG